MKENAILVCRVTPFGVPAEKEAEVGSTAWAFAAMWEACLQAPGLHTARAGQLGSEPSDGISLSLSLSPSLSETYKRIKKSLKKYIQAMMYHLLRFTGCNALTCVPLASLSLALIVFIRYVIWSRLSCIKW